MQIEKIEVLWIVSRRFVMSRRFIVLALLLAATSGFPAAPNSRPTQQHIQVSTWSRSAQPLPYAVKFDASEASLRIPSPNGQYEIACNTTAVERRVSHSPSERAPAPNCAFVASGKRMPIDLEVGPEALWAPDSRAVAITHSRTWSRWHLQGLHLPAREHGADGYRRRGPSTILRDAILPAWGRRPVVAHAIESSMRRNVGWVNVAAIRWMEDSDRLLMMAGSG